MQSWTPPDSDTSALSSTTESVRSPEAPHEPNVATRSQTHVEVDMWLDATLDLPGPELDPRQRLAWRFKAAFSAWKMLLPICAPNNARGQLVEGMRRYERLLRESGPKPRNLGDKQLSDVLHMRLSEAKTAELDRALSELEGLLQSADAGISQEAFRARWNREHSDLRLLLRYARFLAATPFDVGYRRDRFEALALELLTIKLPSGRLQLMARRRARQVLRQLLRGLHQPSVLITPESKQSVAQLREALDRLDTMTGPKQFFDSGLYMDVYRYKISSHERALHPEFLYLCVAIEVDIHNLLLAWSQDGAFSLAALQVQLRAQKEAAQAGFSDFHKPLAGRTAQPKAASLQPLAARKQTQRTRLLAAGLCAAAAFAATALLYW
jgi:hypothetical protein